MAIAGLIVAAGRGTRMGAEAPKQYLRLHGDLVLTHAIRALLASNRVDKVQVVIHSDDASDYATAIAPLNDPRLLPPAYGAGTRSGSVLNGLEALATHALDHVLIHDAARPFLPSDVLSRVIDATVEYGAAFPALPVVDALWQANGDSVSIGPDRTGLLRAQTPQGFHFGDIRAAHLAASEPAMDDVALAIAAGTEVRAVDGDEANFKITTQQDFQRAEQMTKSIPQIRTGNGYDVHRFAPGGHVTLCGIDIPHDRTLSGHSDADVAMHALTDAIFGALAEGDIGQWFPPSDPQWKSVASKIFLQKAVERAGVRGFAITHLDCTIICETPKIGPHTGKMRANLSEITQISADVISVKATTSEGLGFTGRSEGIAAQATATLVAK